MANLVSHLHTHINRCQNRASLQGDFQILCNSVSRKLKSFYKEKRSAFLRGRITPQMRAGWDLNSSAVTLRRRACP